MPAVPTPLPADETLDPLEVQDLQDAQDVVEDDDDPLTDEEVAQEVDELRKAFEAVAPDTILAEAEDEEEEEDEAVLLDPNAAPAPKRTKGSAISQELIDAPLTVDDLFDKGAL